jgi:hypothetical protein
MDPETQLVEAIQSTAVTCVCHTETSCVDGRRLVPYRHHCHQCLCGVDRVYTRECRGYAELLVHLENARVFRDVHNFERPGSISG